MINIYGEDTSPEHEAAQQLRELILAEHPHLANGENDMITIIAGAKCHGQSVSDLDLVLLANFNPPLIYHPFLSFAHPWYPDRLERPTSVAIESLCVVIEVKDHQSKKVRFRGTTANVKYRGAWHNVTEQSFKQRHAFRNYLTINKIRSPFVTNLIWFRNLQNVDLPTRPHNIVAGNLNWDMLVNVIAQVSPPRYNHDGDSWLLTANEIHKETVDKIQAILTKELVPTQLDRHRMEQINQRTIAAQNLQAMVGQKMLLLRGRGGAGKTIRLLQLAKSLYEQEGARVLILTYNKALVGDLRRILTILGVTDDVADRSIRIQTVHSFFYAMTRDLGLLEEREADFLEHYDDLKRETLNLFNLDLLLDRDVTDLKANNHSDFLWDYIFVDEAQDWPDDERHILLRLYSPAVFTIADGIDQLIRSATPANWLDATLRKEQHIVPLRRCLRMKAGLTRFISTFAGQLGLPPAEWVPNQEVPGGRIIIMEGHDKLQDQDFFTQLINENSRANNEPIDMLFCVPPNLARNEVGDVPAANFLKWGFKVWDGTDPAMRESYATDNTQLRFVQYESCRGLEGWTAVNFELDTFYEYKLRHLNPLNDTTVSGASKSVSDPAQIRLRAGRWLLIPLTRAMDTLVIHITERDSAVRQALKATAMHHKDFVEWL